MTEKELRTIRKRCEKATPGPWTWGGTKSYLWSNKADDSIFWCEYHYGLKGRLWIVYGRTEKDADGEVYFEILNQNDAPAGENGMEIEGPVGDCRPSASDRAFIARSRTDVEKLLDEIDRLQRLLKKKKRRHA